MGPESQFYTSSLYSSFNLNRCNKSNCVLGSDNAKMCVGTHRGMEVAAAVPLTCCSRYASCVGSVSPNAYIFVQWCAKRSRTQYEIHHHHICIQMVSTCIIVHLTVQHFLVSLILKTFHQVFSFHFCFFFIYVHIYKLPPWPKSMSWVLLRIVPAL